MNKKMISVIVGAFIVILLIFAFIYIKSNKHENVSSNNDSVQENIKNKTKNKKEELSPEEKKYQEATKAEELKYYTYAKNKYKEILSYKDSQEKYDKLIEKLKIYNGTYKGESNTYKNVKVDMVIEDGEITLDLDGDRTLLNFDGETKSKFDMYGYVNDKGVEEIVFSEHLEFLITENAIHNYDKYAIFIMNGNDIVVSSRIGNSYKTWNGYYKKQ